jgi:protein TonB
MPADLFRSAVASTPARRRASLLPVSLLTHVAIIAVAVLMPVLADGELPPVATASPAYVSIELPPPAPPPLGREPARSSSTSNPDAAPVNAPPDILPEPAIAPSAGAIGAEEGEGFDDLPGLVGGVDAPIAALPPAPPPPPKAPVRPGGRIEAPRIVTRVQPVYPPIAQASRVGGLVIIEALIAEDGRVRNATVLKGHPLLNQAALDAVRQWVFTPTRLNGDPVAVLMTVTVVFSLN